MYACVHTKMCVAHAHMCTLVCTVTYMHHVNEYVSNMQVHACECVWRYVRTNVHRNNDVSTMCECVCVCVCLCVCVCVCLCSWLSEFVAHI